MRQRGRRPATACSRNSARRGVRLSNGLFLILGLILSDAEFREWGWRIPFLLSALLVGIGLWVRLKLTETPAFAAALEEITTAGGPASRAMADPLKCCRESLPR